MKIEGSHTVNAPRERVFDLLTNPDILQKCIPGCEQLVKTAENQFNARLSAGAGPVKGVFTATVSLEDLRRPEHFKLAVEGKGQPGFVKGSGALDFTEEGEQTVVQYVGDVNVGGLLASVGQRMIQGAARMMVGRFFTALEEEAKAKQKTSLG